MIGRITQMMTTSQVLNDITNAQDQMDTTAEQLSSGKRINQPSDDPYGASLAVQLNSDMAGLSNYSSSITDGTAWSAAADTSLQNMQGMVQRVQELVVGAANGTESATDRAAAATEVTQLAAALKQEANTQYDGQYIFSGTATGTPPYSAATGDVFQGNTSAVTRQIGPNSPLQVNADVSSVLGSGTSANDGKLLDTLNTIAADLNGGSPAQLSDLSTRLTSLQSNQNTLLQLQATVGSTTNRLSLAATRIQGLQTSDTAALSNDQDADMAATMTTYSNQQAAFQAALRAGANIVQSSLMQFLS
jgi:flagellar hook-associated protein 3 FlgL